MAYIQKNNPFPVTSCGRRRTFTQGGSPGKDRTEKSPFSKIKEKFKSHMMYSKTGESKTANTHEEHLNLQKKGGDLKCLVL